MAAGGTAASSHGSRGSAAALELSLDRRFQVVTNTMESIQGLSMWCIDNKKYHNNIVRAWLKWIKQSEVPHRLNLFYLANDVIQNCKRRNAIVYRTSFTTALPDAMDVFSTVDDPKVRRAVERTLTIWEERNVYSEEFIAQLRNQLQEKEPEEPAVATPVETPTATPKVTAAQKSKIVAEFVPQTFIQKLLKHRSSVDEVDLREKQQAAMRVNVCSTEALKKLKDKAGGKKFAKDFEEGSAKLQEFVSILEGQVKKGPGLLEALQNADIFYEMQYKEVKIVTKAYETFANRVNHLKRKLDALKGDLPSTEDSPLPSPFADAPSPAGSESPFHGLAHADHLELESTAMADSGAGPLIPLADAPSPLPSPGGSPIPEVGQSDKIEVEDMEMSDSEDSDGGGGIIAVEEPLETPIVPVTSNPVPTPVVTQPAVASEATPSLHQAAPSKETIPPTSSAAAPLLHQAAPPQKTTTPSSSTVARSFPEAVQSLIQAPPSQVHQATPSQVHQATPSQVHQATPSQVHQATPSQVHQAAASKETAAPSTTAVTSSLHQAVPSFHQETPLVRKTTPSSRQVAPANETAVPSNSAVTSLATPALPPALANVDLGKISSILNSIMKNTGGSRPPTDPPVAPSTSAPPLQSSSAAAAQSPASLASILAKVDTNTLLSALSKTQGQGRGMQGFSSILNTEGRKTRENPPASTQPANVSFPAPSKDTLLTGINKVSSLPGKQGAAPSSFMPKQAPAAMSAAPAPEKPGVPEQAAPSNLDSRLHSFFQGSEALAAFGLGPLRPRGPGSAPTLGQLAVSNSPSLGQENLGGTPVRDESGGTPTQDEPTDASGNIIPMSQGGPLKTGVKNTAAPTASAGQPAPAYGHEFWRKQNAPAQATLNGMQFQQVDYNGMGKANAPSNSTAELDESQKPLPNTVAGGGLPPPDRQTGPVESRPDKNMAEGGWYGQQYTGQQSDLAVGSLALNYGKERPDAPTASFFNTPLPPIPSLPPPPKDVVPGAPSGRLDREPLAEPHKIPNCPEDYRDPPRHGLPQHDLVNHERPHFEPPVREDMFPPYPDQEEGMRHPDGPPYPQPRPYDDHWPRDSELHPHPHRPPGPERDPRHPKLGPGLSELGRGRPEPGPGHPEHDPEFNPRHPELEPRHPPHYPHSPPHHLPRQALSPPPGPMGDYYASGNPPRPPIRPGYYDEHSPSPPPFEDPYYDRYYDREARSPSPPPFPHQRPLSPHALPPEYDLPPEFEVPPDYDLPPDFDPYDHPPPHHRHPPHPFHPRPPRPFLHEGDLSPRPLGPRRPMPPRPPRHHHPHDPYRMPMKRPRFAGPPRGGGPFYPPKRPFLPPRF